MQQVPLRRMSQPEDIAGLVAWLLSPDARGVTGQAIDSTAAPGWAKGAAPLALLPVHPQELASVRPRVSGGGRSLPASSPPRVFELFLRAHAHRALEPVFRRESHEPSETRCRSAANQSTV